jgi:rubrerythrin
MGEIDAANPVITYCKAGIRSRSAATLLLGAGFADVRSMEGGMDAWQGLRATGPYDHGLSIVTEGLAPGEVLGLALTFERGSGEFYRGLAEIFAGEEAAKTFTALVHAEEAHVKTIVAAAGDLGTGPLGDGAGEGLMEGAVSIEEALSWCREEGRTPFEALELAMQAETNSLDLYLKMLRRADITPVHNAIRSLAEEEKNHLRKLAALLEKSA